MDTESYGSFVRYKKLKSRVKKLSKRHSEEKMLLFILILQYGDPIILQYFIKDKSMSVNNNDLLRWFIIATDIKTQSNLANFILANIDVNDSFIKQTLYDKFIRSGVTDDLFSIKIFLNDSRFDPLYFNNNGILRASYESYLNGVASAEGFMLLLDDPRIWNKLTPEEKQEFYVFTAKGG